MCGYFPALDADWQKIKLHFEQVRNEALPTVAALPASPAYNPLQEAV
jgi:hypothetical protein